MLLYEDLTHEIIGAALAVYRQLGGGFLEAVYTAALCRELEKRGIGFKEEEPILVRYDDLVLKGFRCDIWVEDKVLLEVKSAPWIQRRHWLQARNYLAASGLRLALVLNFGPTRLTWKRIIV